MKAEASHLPPLLPLIALDTDKSVRHCVGQIQMGLF
jgi:hypothetical protein